MAAAGDTIIVKAGSYGSNGAGTGGFPVQVNKAGTAAAPITLRSETKWGAVLDCNLTCHSYINLLDNAAYWVIQDFDITRGYWAGIWGNSATHHITMRGNHFHHIGNRNDTSDFGIEGFYSDVLSHDMAFDGNMFNDIGRTNILPQGPNHDHGIYSSAVNGTATNNIFYNMFRGWSIQLVDGATNWLISYNTFAFPNPGRSGQIVLYGGNNGGNVTVNNTTVRNNIFYQPGGYAITTNTGVALNGCLIDHNIIYGPAQVIDQLQNCSMAANQMNSNPMLVNAAIVPYDWHLQATSPAIGAAVAVAGVNSDYYGLSRPQTPGPDIGAAEFPSVPPPQPPLTISVTWANGVPACSVK